LEEWKSHSGQSDKLDKITEEIKVYGKVCDEDLQICSDFEGKSVPREGREIDLDDNG